MKFCPVCKKMYNGTQEKCTLCNKKYQQITDINEPVMLCVTGGIERNMICGALKDAEIPFVEQSYGAPGVANEVVTGYDAKLLNISILVPYSAFPKAYEIAQSVGVCDDMDEQFVELVNEDIEKYKQSLDSADDTQMSAAKRTTIKVVSAIAFLIIIGAVVIGTDAITEWIKNLFGGMAK